jgi:hypothetical protein
MQLLNTFESTCNFSSIGGISKFYIPLSPDFIRKPVLSPKNENDTFSSEFDGRVR